MLLKLNYYKIIINSRVLLLIPSAELQYVIPDNTSWTFEYSENKKSILEGIESLEKGVWDKVVIYHDDLKKLWKDFRSHYKMVEAAGGLVCNPKGKILFIFRNGKWDLPKGKIEKNEHRRVAAIREVKEECGLKNVEIVKKINTTYHTYLHGGSRKLKWVHWYWMYSTDKKLVPQEEENITKAVWKKFENFIAKPRSTYKNIVDVLQKYHFIYRKYNAY